MKKLLLTLIIISTSLTSTISNAGGNFSVNIGLGYGGYGYGHNYGYKNHYRRNSYSSYGHKYGYSDRYIKFGHGYRSHKYNDRLTGALVLGGLVGYGISKLYNNHHHHKNHYDPSSYLPKTYKTHTTRIVSRNAQSTETHQSGRRLHKDRNGHCFEIKRAQNGDELKIELDPSQCDW